MTSGLCSGCTKRRIDTYRKASQSIVKLVSTIVATRTTPFVIDR